jgi:hypothetical protein
LSPKPFHPSIDALTGVVSFAFDERVSSWNESSSFAVHCVLALKSMFLDETLPLCAKHNVAKNHFAVAAYSFDKTHFRNHVQRRIANTLIDDNNQISMLSESSSSGNFENSNNNNDNNNAIDTTKTAVIKTDGAMNAVEINDDDDNNNNNNNNSDDNDDDAEENGREFSIRFSKFETKHVEFRTKIFQISASSSSSSSSSVSSSSKPAVVGVVSSIFKGIADVLRE